MTASLASDAWPQQPRVLVVQPNRNYCAVLARRIADGGYRVTTVENAQRAMAELHRLPIDLVLSELRMPLTSGVELVRMIREDPTYCDVPLFLITGKSDAEGAVQAYRCGADTVIAKPFDFEVLIARIGRDEGHPLPPQLQQRLAPYSNQES